MAPNGDRYVCKCVKYDDDHPCSWVWVNIDAQEFSYLALAKQMAITSQKAFFIFQNDGNLVVYDEFGEPRWASHTVNLGDYAVFQTDGNLVVYNGSGRAVWASNTCCYSGNYLSVQNDGNVVIYTWWGFPLWATGTNH